MQQWLKCFLVLMSQIFSSAIRKLRENKCKNAFRVVANKGRLPENMARLSAKSLPSPLRAARVLAKSPRLNVNMAHVSVKGTL